MRGGGYNAARDQISRDINEIVNSCLLFENSFEIEVFDISDLQNKVKANIIPTKRLTTNR